MTEKDRDEGKTVVQGVEDVTDKTDEDERETGEVDSEDIATF